MPRNFLSARTSGGAPEAANGSAARRHREVRDGSDELVLSQLISAEKSVKDRQAHREVQDDIQQEIPKDAIPLRVDVVEGQTVYPEIKDAVQEETQRDLILEDVHVKFKTQGKIEKEE